MKKIFFFVALATCAAAIVASCNKAEQKTVPSISEAQSQIYINASQEMVQGGILTKGYATGATFDDVVAAQLHEASPTKTDRAMRLSAYQKPVISGGTGDFSEEGNYFVDYLFEKVSAGKWSHNPSIYWPISAKLDFLAYSSLNAFPEEDVEWNSVDAASSVVLNMLPSRSQDDVLFCSVYEQASSAGATSVPMQFKHSQAWIEFQLSVADASMANTIEIEQIIVENVYNSGELTIRNNSGNAEATWSFRKEIASDLVFDDTFSVYGSQGAAPLYAVTNGLDATTKYLDQLFPEQNRTSFVVKYRLAGQPNLLSYRFSLDSSAKWLMGNKYVYVILFTTNEITVAPTVKAYQAGSVTDLSGELI